MPTRILTTLCIAYTLTSLGATSSVAAQRADTVVRNAGAPIHAGVASLVREASFGVVDGAEEYMFGEISEVAVARDGSMYVYDRHVPALRKYDVNGKFVKTFGRKGQGPGEYLNAGGLAVTSDGRVLLWDTGNWRINVYSADGAVLPSFSTASGATGSTLSTARSLLVDTAGRIYISRRVFSRGGRGMASQSVWIRYQPDGTPLDTLPAPTFTVAIPVLTATAPGGNASTSMEVPYSAVPKWVMSPIGTLITGVADRYAFEIHAGPTQPIVSVRRTVAPLPVSGHERDSARNAVTTRMRQTEPAWTWSGPDIPKNRPFYANIFAGDDGRIWLPIVAEVTPRLGSVSSLGMGVGNPGMRRPAASSDAPPIKTAPALYDVFEPNGTYLGQVQVPPRVSSAVRRGDYIWAIEYGEDDVQKVTRFRISWK